MEGIILEAETGDYLGNHRGFWFYTIGQRQGLRLPGGPWYDQLPWLAIINVLMNRLFSETSHADRVWCCLKQNSIIG